MPAAEIDATVDKLLPQVQDTATLEDARAGVEVGDVRIRALLCCPGCDADATPTQWCVRGPDMLAYINLCLNPSVPRPRCSTRYPLKLWGGFLAPLVAYVKTLPSDQAPSLADLRRNITSTGAQ